MNSPYSSVSNYGGWCPCYRIGGVGHFGAVGRKTLPSRHGPDKIETDHRVKAG